jgi:hypothetical protein
LRFHRFNVELLDISAMILDQRFLEHLEYRKSSIIKSVLNKTT